MEDKIWIKFYKNGTLNDSLTFGDAEKYINEKVHLYQSQGISSQDTVLVQLPNSIETIITYLALYRIKAIVVPVLENIFLEKLKFIIKDCDVKAHITLGGMKTLRDTHHQSPASLDQTTCTLIYTSGTTGTPKGVRLSWNNRLCNSRALINHHQLDTSSIVASPLLLSHCNAHGFAMLTTYFAKSQLILFDRYCENLLSIIRDEKVQILSLVPTILHKLFEENPQWIFHKEMKYILTAAAPLDYQLFDNVYKNWNVQLVQGYGLSESTNFSCTMPINLSNDTYINIMSPHPSIGVTLEGVRIRIGDDDIENKIGELFIISPSNSRGYYKKQEISSKERLQTGDYGYYKIYGDQRFYYLTGRTKEVINRGGEKISPLEVETELRHLGMTGEFTVIKISDEKYGEEVAIACTGTPIISPISMIPFYRRPKKVFILDKLHYTETGKIQRNQISEDCIFGKYKSFIDIK